MSFFDKVKQGASDAAKKAQQTVEITKLKAQISGKEKDIEKLCVQIGTAVYRGHQAGNIAANEQEVIDCCRQADELQAEIRMLEERIKMTRNEKTCTCGKVVALDAKFCPDCGAALAEEPRAENTVGEIVVICNQCHTENELNAKFCVSCGGGLNSTAAEATY
ncbi:zinc ribbon domain-containing protein [Paenibacillus sacheonensis]|uniref:Zinc ribbon domain-containing protein n=1 Tax=Paenibacillus sacheonensis TaxID=742054 RepID=A0A7X4YWD5_9BACL|nr:zinc ribbon domain-containing protein [Paenibacillus sacheonensis]MBM7567292.1 co-chaperonin GroES (HSP10) [Paenibacillus sacheonensis]NBC72816.1 zinc ribbon domain-containing protein [Paenibacillus sacheonensis]